VHETSGLRFSSTLWRMQPQNELFIRVCFVSEYFSVFDEDRIAMGVSGHGLFLKVYICDIVAAICECDRRDHEALLLAIVDSTAIRMATPLATCD
jgi:hypothetical protein